MRTTIQKVDPRGLEKLTALASEIWHEHYGRIFGGENARHLTQFLQNPETISAEMAEGYVYYFIKLQNTTIGYFNFLSREDDIYIGKLYVLSEYRSRGLGREVFSAVEKEGVLLSKKHLRLCVNSASESTIRFYTSQGMKIIKTETNEYDGIVSVDLTMEKDICPIEKSLRFYSQGYNCCQSVVMGFSTFLDLKGEDAIKIGLAFGGGFSSSRNICGSLSAIGMVVGLLEGDTASDDKIRLLKTTKELTEKFRAQNTHILCGELLKNLKIIEVKGGGRTLSGVTKTPSCVKIVENASIILLEHLMILHKSKKEI